MRRNISLEVRDVERTITHKKWDELPQVTDDYVVHARGYNVSDMMWFDVYNFCTDHMNLWNKEVRDVLDYPPYEDEEWVSYADKYVEEPWLYWCVTGGSGFTIQRQVLDDMTEDQMQLVFDVIEELQIPEDETVTFYDSLSNSSDKLGVREFYNQVEE